MGPGGPKWGQDDFFLLIQTLPTFWAERILILRIFIFLIFLDFKFPDFWVQDFQISSLGPGLGWGPSGGPGARVRKVLANIWAYPAFNSRR